MIIRFGGRRIAPAAALTFAAVSFCTALAVATSGCGGGSPTAPSQSPPVSPVQDPASATSLTYTSDIQPILAADCVSCHGGSVKQSGYDFSTYAGVMRAVAAGNANSLLVRVTQPGGLMYGEFRGSAAPKAETFRRWVVDFNAAQ